MNCFCKGRISENKVNVQSLYTIGKQLSGCAEPHLQVIVVGILSKAPVEEGPCEVVHGILLAGDGLVHNLSHHVVMQEVIQMTLHWVRLEQELLVVLLARCVTHQHTPAVRATLVCQYTDRQNGQRQLDVQCMKSPLQNSRMHKQAALAALRARPLSAPVCAGANRSLARSTARDAC